MKIIHTIAVVAATLASPVCAQSWRQQQLRAQMQAGQMQTQEGYDRMMSVSYGISCR